MSAEGRNLRRLTHTRAFESAPAWSPDGKQIAFSSTRGGGETSLYVMNADGGKVEKLEAGGEAQSPAWSPDGKEIAYAASFEGYLEIHVITLKNGKVRRLTEGLHAISPAWSPDGKQIAFIAYAHGSPEVYVMNDKGKKLQRLTTDSAADADPVWSPDGKRILFTSDRGGVPWLYTVRADGSALNRLPLPNRITGAYQGDWSRDGRIIFSLWGQTPVNPAKMSADAPAPATLVYSPTPTPTEPTMVVMSAPEAVTGYNRTISYEYDSLYRLTGATTTEGATVNEYLYGYDLRGNRTSVTAPEVGTFSYTYNLANQISYPGFTYDLNGNLTRDGYATYTYDAANRLRGVDTGVDATTYQYDGLGNRIGMTHNNVETAYLLDPSGALSQVLRETTGGVNTLYLHGLDIIGQQQGGTWTGFGYDPLGSVRFLLTNTGAIASRADYDPYGVPLPVPGQESGMDTALGFTGEQTDPLGLVNLRARTYNPRLGTFTSVDPVLGVGGSTGWNGYLYANANPANLTDPSGACIGPLTFLLPACIAAGKLLIGGLAGATIVGGAAFVNDVRGQVWYNQTQAGLSFIDSFQHLNVAGLIDSTVKGAEFGFNLGTGFGAGALAQKFGFAGAKAIAAGLASDVILGASWDIAAHGDNFFAAVAGNTLGFLGGELAGDVFQRGFRIAQRGLSMADDLLVRAGRWYNATFDRYALSSGFPLLKRGSPQKGYVSGFVHIRNLLKHGEYDEIEAARALRANGIDVHIQMPVSDMGIRNQRTADLILGGKRGTGINGTIWEVYTPQIGTPPNRIASKLTHKLSQADRIIINLNHSTIIPSDISNLITRVNNTPGISRSLEEVMFIRGLEIIGHLYR